MTGASLHLSQDEADTLISLRKWVIDEQTIALTQGRKQCLKLRSEERTEKFVLDMQRGSIRLTKFKYQTRGRRAIVLVRLDIDSAPHTNPDGSEVGPTHVHVYREGFDDKWACELDPKFFGEDLGYRPLLERFCAFCHIETRLSFEEPLC